MRPGCALNWARSLHLPRLSLRLCMDSLLIARPPNSVLLSLGSKTHLRRHLRYRLRVLRMLASLWMLLWPDTMPFSENATRESSLLVPRIDHPICISPSARVVSHGVTRTSIWSLPKVLRAQKFKMNTVLRCRYHSKLHLKSPQ